MHVCEYEVLFICCALKCDPGLIADDAVHTVTANQPCGVDGLDRAILTNLHLDLWIRCIEADDLAGTGHVPPEFCDMVEQTSLDLVLWAHQRETILAIDL